MYYDNLKRRVRQYKAVQSAVKEDRVNILDLIAPAYYSLHDDVIKGNHEIYNLPGGRGSCKSSFVALEIVDGIMNDSDANAIAFRRVGVTLRDSVYNQIQWAIDELGVSALWKSSVSPMQFTYKPTGQVIVLRGLDDPLKSKSIKARHGIFKYLWFEEFAEIQGENTIRSIRQSVLRGGTGFRTFNSFNPPLSKNNWANKYVEKPNEKAVTFRTTYKDIPPEWLGESFILEAERLHEINEMAYLNEYMGEAIGAGGEVFPNLEIRGITDEEIETFDYTRCGLDFGFAVDPAAFIRLAYNAKTGTIYLLDEIYKRNLSNADLAAMIKEKGYDRLEGGYYSVWSGTVLSERQRIICDSAEPKSIADLQGHGLHATACDKWPGSVQYGVKWLQQKKIVIDPARTPNAYKEFVGYEYIMTKDNEFTSDLPDKDNHLIDATRYSLNHEIKNKRHSA